MLDYDKRVYTLQIFCISRLPFDCKYNEDIMYCCYYCQDRENCNLGKSSVGTGVPCPNVNEYCALHCTLEELILEIL